MFYKYESDFDNDLMFWSNATADLWHKGEIGESDLPDELLHALNELWTDSHLVCCYLVEFKGRYGVALESIYDRDFAESLGVTYSELLKRVEKRRLEYQDRRMANAAEHAKVTRAIRYDVLRRDNFRCVRCGRGKEDGVKLHVDHIVPVSRGGKSVMDNLQTLCEDCNYGKGNKYKE